MAVLDATIGSATANSYVTRSEAVELIPLVASKSRSDAWIALAGETQDVYLMRAVKMMETYLEFEGQRVDEDQPIAWPRDWVYGPDRCTVLPTTEVPDAVKEAQCLMALCLSEGFDQDTAGGSPIDRLKISSLQINFASSRSARGALLLPAEVVEKLRGFGEYVGASGMARCVKVVRT